MDRNFIDFEDYSKPKVPANIESMNRVLILGGSKFMGKSLLLRLMHLPNTHVFVINRFKKHWNGEAFKAKNCSFYYGERRYTYQYIKILEYVTKVAKIDGKSKNSKWTLVIDFCAFVRKHIKQVIKAISHKLLLYVFISTDSIYDVCAKEVRLEPRILETDALRPCTEDEIEELKKNEEYGHDKLRCEEYLESHCKEYYAGFRYLVLRLPDVIGPYDSSGRYWAYLIWLHRMEYWPVHRQEGSDTKKLSFVASEDVARTICELYDRLRGNGGDGGQSGEALAESLHTEAINLCFDETPTLVEFIEILAKTVDLEEINWIEAEKLEGNLGTYHYPSVECGPIDNTKAKKLLNWKPAVMEPYMKWTSEFYKNVASQYFRESRIANELMWEVQRENKPASKLPDGMVYEVKSENPAPQEPGEDEPLLGEEKRAEKAARGEGEKPPAEEGKKKKKKFKIKRSKHKNF